MVSKGSIGLLLPLALTACHEGVTLTVSQSRGGTITLGVAAFSSDFHPCIDVAIVSPVDQQDKPVWELGRADLHSCVQEVTVGSAGPGFAQRSSTPLRSGNTYCAEVNGPGFTTRRGFTIDRNGVVQSGEDVAAC